MKPYRPVTPWLVLALVLAGCSRAPEPAHLLWSEDVNALENPFPDQRFVQSDGVHLRPGWYTPFLSGLTAGLKTYFDKVSGEAEAEISGIGNFGPVLLRTSEPVDPSTLAGTVARLKKTSSG